MGAVKQHLENVALIALDADFGFGFLELTAKGQERLDDDQLVAYHAVANSVKGYMRMLGLSEAHIADKVCEHDDCICKLCVD